MKNANTVFLDEIPNCSICEERAEYHAKTLAGPWAYLCNVHWRLLTNKRIGLNVGQRVDLRRNMRIPSR